MKIISSSATTDDVIEIRLHLNIDCFFSDSEKSDITSASEFKRRLTGQDSLIYSDFIVSVIQKMKRHGYTPEINPDVSHRSNKDNSNSIYYAFIKDTVMSGKKVRLVVFTRISDHDDSDAPATELIKRTEHYDGEATRYRKDGLEPEHKLVSLYIQDHKMSTYGEALSYLNRAVNDFETTTAAKVESGEI